MMKCERTYNLIGEKGVKQKKQKNEVFCHGSGEEDLPQKVTRSHKKGRLFIRLFLSV
jgi:hypothetical protein